MSRSRSPKGKLAFALPGALAMLLSVRAAGASTFAVTKTADTNDGSCSSDCSLREALRAANAHPGLDSVLVPSGVYPLQIPGKNEDNCATGDLDITDSVVVQGSGNPTVDGKGLDRVFHVVDDVGPVVLQGLTIQGGRAGGAPGNGGGVNVGSGVQSVLIDNSSIVDNAGKNGGGIALGGGDSSLTISSSTIARNVARTRGSSSKGGGIFATSSSHLAVTDSVISDNEAGAAPISSSNGGGIACLDCWLNVTRTILDGNLAGDSGGGAWVFNDFDTETPLELAGVTVSNNTAAWGGGISVDATDSPVVISHSTIQGNQAQAGGGIACRGDHLAPHGLELLNCTISGNTAELFGGGLSVGAPALYDSPPTYLRECTFSLNTAQSGSAVFFDSYGTHTSTNVLIEGGCSGSTTSLGGNLEGPGDTCGFDQASDQVNVPDPGLLPLAFNGGPTRTHAIPIGSPAIDAGVAAGCTTTDQRGKARPSGGACDTGSYERQVSLGIAIARVNWELNPWPYIYIYDGCPGPIVLPSDVEEVTVTVELQSPVALSFELARGPHVGTAELVGNVLTYHAVSGAKDEVLLVASDGRTSNLVRVPFDFAGCDAAGPAPVGNCSVEISTR